MLHSYKPGSFFVAALAAFAVQESALAHIEALPGYRLPFVEACLAQGDALGADLQAGFAVGLQVDDVVHLEHSNAESGKSGSIGLTSIEGTR